MPPACAAMAPEVAPGAGVGGGAARRSRKRFGAATGPQGLAWGAARGLGFSHSASKQHLSQSLNTQSHISFKIKAHVYAMMHDAVSFTQGLVWCGACGL